MEYSPHNDADLDAMLASLGKSSLDDLFAHLPSSLRISGELALPPGLSEDEVLRRAAELAGRNDVAAICFAGGGCYDHYVPAVVGAVAARGEFLTAYTPYQPEVSQGMLQALFEYQTAISELTGLPVSNASLYDGGSAVAEAVAMACDATRRKRVLMGGGLDGSSRRIVRTYARPLERHVDELAVDATTGRTPVGELTEGLAAVVLQQPNALGVVEDVRAHAEAAHAVDAKLIVKLEPLATGLLATPGSQGADLVVGEGQPLGQGLSYGGPTVGFLACREDQVRRVPGRIVGRTVDRDGRTGYVMTLRAREQDIRRERATSNICTNQTLNALMALVYLSWLGPQGLRELAVASLARAGHAAERLADVPGVTVATTGPFLKEFPVRLDVDDPTEVVRRAHLSGYLIGPVVQDGPFAGCVMIAVTERRSRDEVDGLADALGRIVKEVG